MLGKKSSYDVATTVIGADITIEAALIKGASTVRLDGSYIGNVEIEGDMIIGKTGYIKGNVKLKNIVVAGKVDGDVVCSGEVRLSESAVMNGNITTGILVVDEGAIFNGNCSVVRNIENRIDKKVKKEVER